MRLFSPAPSDEQLWDLLRENCAHMAIDNQVQMLPCKTGMRYEKALAASATHIDFIDNCDGVMDTFQVLGQPLLNDRENNGNAYIAGVIEHFHPEHFRRIDLNRETLKATENPQGKYWIDALHPNPLRHRIAIKTDNNMFSGTSFCTFDLDDALRTRGNKRVMPSGFLAGVCLPQSAWGAHRRGYDLIVDPAQCYDPVNFKGSSFGKTVWNYPLKTVITEPGQVEHVVRKFAPRPLILTP